MTLLNMKSLFKALTGIFAGAVLVLSHSANAVIIEYELTDLGGGDFLYEYTVTNDDFAPGVAGLTFYFEADEIDELSLVFGAPAGWDPLLLPGTLGLVGAAIDFFALFTTPIALGDTLGGFSLEFTWTGGPGGPGDQFFEYYDDLGSGFLPGFTVAAPPPPPPPGIPEPATLSLLMMALVGLMLGRKKHKA